MSARSKWKGFLNIGLISFPVKAFGQNVTGANEVKLNQLHAGCDARINYKKICSKCQKDVKQEDIISGYEFAKDNYVKILPEELESFYTETDKAIHVDAFVPASSIDPVYFEGKGDYLLPDGTVSVKPYFLVWDVLKKTNTVGIATTIRYGKRQLLALRPFGRLIGYHQLKFMNEVEEPTAFEAELQEVQASSEEMDLMKQLVQVKTPKKFDMSQYKDEYAANLTALIHAKQAGKEVIVVQTPKAASPSNLMDALRASVEKAKEAEKGKANGEPKKKTPAKKK